MKFFAGLDKTLNNVYKPYDFYIFIPESSFTNQYGDLLCDFNLFVK